MIAFQRAEKYYFEIFRQLMFYRYYFPLKKAKSFLKFKKISKVKAFKNELKSNILYERYDESEKLQLYSNYKLMMANQIF